jgi:hypothetical protein
VSSNTERTWLQRDKTHVRHHGRDFVSGNFLRTRKWMGEPTFHHLLSKLNTFCFCF